MQIAVVVNPTSGKRRGEHIARDAVRFLREQGHQVDELRGEDARDAHGQLAARIDDVACLGPLPLTAEVVPRALTMIVGAA